jgi:hypothetical protein
LDFLINKGGHFDETEEISTCGKSLIQFVSLSIHFPSALISALPLGSGISLAPDHSEKGDSGRHLRRLSTLLLFESSDEPIRGE